METKYGTQARIGERFYEQVEHIKIQRIIEGKSKEKPSTKTITNLIARHKDFKKIVEDIINLNEGELNEE